MSISNLEDRPIVVGIGASAGGLEAFRQLLKGLPDQHDLVLVLVQHLDPDHQSLMPELLQAKTASPVHSVTDNMDIKPGHIYLIPPGYEMEITGEQLKLTKFDAPRGLRRPIDHFLRSLAAEYGEHAVAIILSGTGSDGAEGAREVKGQGGLVLVQDPQQAKYDGMPRSVLDYNGADVTTNAEELIDIVRDYFSLRADPHPDLMTQGDFLRHIMRHVRYRTGHDFTDYKDATMQRRVAVRMSVLNITDPNAYLKYIVDEKDEAERLFRDLLINVTSFFRDSEHFDTLREDIIPKLISETEEFGELRIWVAGCSTGEEAYSIGIVINEELQRLDKHCRVSIFGTDIDEDALRTARLGRYPDGIADAVPQAYLDRYFVPTKRGYEVGAQLREMVRFSRHSFIKDPPFSRIDLVTCRNVLIYLKNNLQDLAIRVFHNALRHERFLFLGSSENPAAIQHYFDEVSHRARIFQRDAQPARPLNMDSMPSGTTSQFALQEEQTDRPEDISQTDHIILNEFAPAYLHVDAQDNVVYATDNAARYLTVRAGKMTTNIFAMVDDALEPTFRRVARVKVAPGKSNEAEFQGELNGVPERLIVISRRMGDGSQLFIIRDNLQLLDSRPGNADSSNDQYVRQLEAELDEAKQTVRTTVEELETSNEELKSSNEEMMSMNEELQSANEELTTINDEMQEKLRALNQANVDMVNFVQSARVPTVFLDADLNLLSFTPEAVDYFSFTKGDIGRPLFDLNAEIDDDRLRTLCEQTVRDQQEVEEEFITSDRKISLTIRVMPYSPDGQQERGVVFTLQNVTDLRRAISAADEMKVIAEDRLQEVEQIYNSSPIAMGLISSDMRYLRLNDKLAEINGVPRAAHEGKTIRDIIPAVADHTEAIVKQVLQTEKPVLDQLVRGNTASDPLIERIWHSDWVPFYEKGEIFGVSVHVREVTQQVRVEENLREIMRELEHRVKNMLANISALINRAKRDATTDSAVFETLSNRIAGLAKTHTLLTAKDWSSAPLIDVVRPETTDVYGADRVTLSGPPVRLTAEATLAVGMAIHELATNSAKYGAFSSDGGAVTINWSRLSDAKSDRLILTWQESGGPPVTPPEKEGFGSQLIRSTIAGSLDGDLQMNWEPTGLSVVMELDFDDVTVAGGS